MMRLFTVESAASFMAVALATMSAFWFCGKMAPTGVLTIEAQLVLVTGYGES